MVKYRFYDRCFCTKHFSVNYSVLKHRIILYNFKKKRQVSNFFSQRIRVSILVYNIAWMH